MNHHKQFQPRSVDQLHKDYRNDSDGPFASRDQLVAAMSDSRYAHDATYRAKVEARMAKSNPADLGYSATRHDHQMASVHTRSFGIGPASDSDEGRW